MEDYVSVVYRTQRKLEKKLGSWCFRLLQVAQKGNEGEETKEARRKPKEPTTPGGVLGISSDGDDRMELKVKTQKNP